MDLFDLARELFPKQTPHVGGTTPTIMASAAGSSSGGAVEVVMGSDVTNPEPVDIDGEEVYADASTAVEIPTSPSVAEGDDVIVALVGDGPLKAPVVIGAAGSGDRTAQAAADALEAAQAVEGIAQQALDVANATGQYFWHDSAGAHVSTEANEPEGAQNVLINAAGILFRAIANNIVGIVTGTDPGLVIYDGLGNAAANLIGIFTAGLIRIGRIVEQAGSYDASASIGFFDENSSLDVEQTSNADHSYTTRRMKLTNAIADGDGVTAEGRMGVYQVIETSQGETDLIQARASIEAAVQAEGQAAHKAYLQLTTRTGAAGASPARALEASADTLTLDGSGAELVRATVTMKQAIISITRPMATWTAGTGTVTDAAGWHRTDFSTVLAQHGPWSDYFTLANGRITALQDVTLQLTMDLSWNDNVMGIRGAGFFLNSTVGSGINEISSFSAKGANNRFYCVFPPRLITLSSGDYLEIGRYNQLVNSVFTRGTNYTWLTVEVIG